MRSRSDRVVLTPRRPRLHLRLAVPVPAHTKQTIPLRVDVVSDRWPACVASASALLDVFVFAGDDTRGGAAAAGGRRVGHDAVACEARRAVKTRHLPQKQKQFACDARRVVKTCLRETPLLPACVLGAAGKP